MKKKGFTRHAEVLVIIDVRILEKKKYIQFWQPQAVIKEKIIEILFK